MHLDTWWLYLMTTFVISATPGPNMLLVMTHSVRHGFRPALGTMVGCMTALLIMLSISAAGLGALLKAWPVVFDTLRWIGAAYLVWLGYKCWRAPVDTTQGPGTTAPLKDSHWNTLFKQGFLVAASNPKALLFAAAFFPQFIDQKSPALPQFSILLLTFTIVEAGWYLVYAGSGRKIAVYLQNARVLKNFNRATGGVFMGFGAAMAAIRH
ncbi:LysE family translocator [Leeia oryzae]|uniref:LysE family translocator n=1 Tax=Leeia oryzae TaxID=356662 RepID=UPI00047702F4|nr:LysE family translocator [Leeia oryzae]